MDQAKPTWTTPSWPRWASWPGPVAPTATGRAGRCSKRRGIEACPKLSRASSCLFLGRSRSTSLRHPRFPRIGGFHEQRPPVTGIIILSPGNASRLGLDRMRFMSFHVCRRGDLKGYSLPPGDSSSVPNYGCQRRDQHYQPLTGESRPPPYDPQASVDALRTWCGLLVELQPQAEPKGGCPLSPSPASSLRPTPTAAPTSPELRPVGSLDRRWSTGHAPPRCPPTIP